MSENAGMAAVLGVGSVEELERDFRGELIATGEPGYEEARQVWNGLIDRRPALIARCAGVRDVIAAIRFARAHDLLVAVRGGGHNVAGTAVCEGGLVIDLSAMKGIRVDPFRRTVRAEPGLLWGELDAETQLFGLATTGGVVSHTGIAGLTLGGGIGWLMRQHGLTIDNLLSVDLVTAEGDFLVASRTEHPELFWGIRGGGGNFGVVTSFEYRLHPVGPQVLAGVLLYPAEQGEELLRFYRDFIATVPDALNTAVICRRAAPVPWVPVELHGRPVVIIALCYAGPIDEGEQVVAPLRRFCPPLVDLVRPTLYTSHQKMLDASVPHGLHYYWKSHYLPVLTDDILAVLLAHAWQMPTPGSYSILFQMGGAVRQRPDEESAFSGRHAAHALNINGVWPAEAGEQGNIDWVRRFFSALQPYACEGVYVNFLGEEGAERVMSAYGQEKYRRLVALKNRYDPGNFFRLNQNIKPDLALAPMAGAPEPGVGVYGGPGSTTDVVDSRAVKS